MKTITKFTALSFLGCLLSVTAAKAEQVIISEIMYNPSGTKAEYIEIKNISYNPKDIVKWRFSDGVTYEFPDFNSGAAQDAFMKPLERIILSSKDAATTRTEYNIPAQTRVFGPWTGSLSNSGETITLDDKNGAPMAYVSYKNKGRWPKAADGTGHSLMIINENADPDDWHNWKASPTVKGTASTTVTAVSYTDTWEWNIPTSDPGTGWRTTTGGWGSGSSGSGPGMLGYESAVPPGLPTLQTAVGNNTIDQKVYLFRKSFTFSGNASGASYVIDSIADDGVTYYLNGNLLGSVNHTPGAWNNTAILGGDATEQIGILSGGATGLINGNNIFSAEVHQITSPNSDMLFAAKLRITSSSGGGAPSNATVRLSEVHFNANGSVDWVELQNTSASSQVVNDLFLSSQADLSNKVAISGGPISANGYMSFAIPNGGFATNNNGGVSIFLADSANNIKGAADLTMGVGRDTLQAIWPVTPAAKPTWELLKTSPEWYSSTANSQNAANNNITPAINTAIVINEIMNDPMSEQAQAEYIELHNKSGGSVSLTGWKLAGGVDFDFPAGTSIPANGYIIVGGNKAYLQGLYGGVTVVGDWSGKLSNRAEYIRLEDSGGNLADEVDYQTGGDWPDLTGNKGSSMELINPNMDNNRASAWRASDESGKASFATYTYTGTYLDRFDGGGNGSHANRGAFTNDPADYKELHLFGFKDSHIIFKNIKLYPAGGDPSDNKLQNVGQMSGNGNSNNGWLAQGTAGQSYMAGGSELHLIMDGHGDATAGKAEIDCTGINPGSSYTISFDAKWVAGTPVVMAKTWDHSLGSPFRISVPDNLGSPGSQNSRYNGSVPPQVDSIIHSPAVPTASQSVKITARVYSQSGVSSVEARVRQDDINTGYNDNNYQSFTMFDNGSNGDAVSGDGVYTATITNHQVDGRMVQFYVRATASGSGQQAVSPSASVNGQPRNAMWIVDSLTRVDRFPNGHISNFNSPGNEGRDYPRSEMGIANLRRQRFVMSEYDVDSLRTLESPQFGMPTAKYGFKNPRMSNHYYPVTFIHNETDVYYLCEARQSGSRWHRSANMAVFDRLKWKIPNDRMFRKHQKLYTDTDLTKISGLDNHLAVYISYLVGNRAVNEIELAKTTVNNTPVAVRSETELTDNDLIARAFDNGGDGQLVKCAEQLTYRDDYGDSFWPPQDFTYSYRGTDNPARWHGTFPLRNREWEFDYSSFTELFKTWSNSASTREQLDRIVDADQFFMMAAVRGYAGDWDSLTNQGKNGAFYRRPSDNKWLALHWDGDSSFELNSSAEFVFNPFPGLGEFASKPWNRRILNYYLTEILQKWNPSSPRVSAWFTAQQNAVTGAYAYGVPTQYNFPTPYPAQYTTFHSQHQSFVLAEINQNIGTGGAGNAYSASFNINSPGNGSFTGNATQNFSGTAPSSAYRIAIDNHPEAVFEWSNQTTWTLNGVVLKTGSNNLAVRMLDRVGAQVGSVINWTVNKTGNAAPIMKLEAEPDQVKLGELLVLDASASVDPDASALTFSWGSSPGTGFTMTTPTAVPVNSKRHVVFSTPGNYTFTATGNDGTNSTPIAREVSASNASDFESFTIPTIDTSKWTIANMVNKGSSYPSRWYSLYDMPGSLVMNVMENSAKPLSYANSHPTLMRNFTGLTTTGNISILTEVEMLTRKSGTFFAGLQLETVESGATIRYAFGLDYGTHITVKRATSGEVTNVGQLVADGDSAKLRIRRSGDTLYFERKVDGIWNNLFNYGMAGGSTLTKGGVFLATNNAENARAAFDYIMVVDPSNGQPPGGLRITELMYNPRLGSDPEYIEVKNTSGATIQLNGMKFDNGITLNITTSITMVAGESAVFTEDTVKFQAKYPGVRVLAQWDDSTNLSNGGERIVIRDSENNFIHDFIYDDELGWPTYPDGQGGALEVVNTEGNYSDPTNWRSTEDRPGGGSDTDGDGIPDAWEAKFGTNASDPLSKPRATTAVNGSNQTQISWGGVSLQNYRVQYCDNLGDAWQTVTGGGTVPGVNGTVSFTDPQLPRPTKRFYRIMAL